MINGYKVVVVLPSYNAAKTLELTYKDIPDGYVDSTILCDDASSDGTFEIAENLGIDKIIKHDSNKGYGGNQKTLYQEAISINADIIIMLHPDYQYIPKLIPAMVHIIAYDIYPVVLGSRILGVGALKGGMPYYKYVANRMLTFIQNLLTGYKLSEYHTGYRAYKREVLESINYMENSDDFLFDNQLLSQVIYKGYQIGEISCPSNYFEEASSIGPWRSIKYGVGVLGVSFMHFLQRMGIGSFSMYR